MSEIAKRTAIVAGATGGMGHAIAKQLAVSGFELILLGRNNDALRENALHISSATGRIVEYVAFDVRDAVAVSAFAHGLQEKHSAIQALVYAAGDGPVARLTETTDTDWLNTFDVKLMGAVRLMRATADALKAGKASVVLINGALTKQPHPLFPINSAVNCAVSGFAKAAATDFLPDGIRVNVVNPGATQTPLWSTTAQQVGEKFGLSAEAVTADVESKALYNRLTTPEDIAHAVAFLVSPAAQHISGTSLTVDGGALSAL